jgi:hypothetical protein
VGSLPEWVVLASPAVAFLSALVSAGVAAGAIRSSNRNQKEQRTLQQAMQQAEIAEKKQTDLRTERREAYRTLTRITKTVDPTQPYALGDLSDAYSEVELLTESPEVLQAAAELYNAAFQARKVARAKYNAGYLRPEKDEFVKKVIERSQEKRLAFLDAARVELGLPPSPTPLQQLQVSVRELLVQPNEEHALNPAELPEPIEDGPGGTLPRPDTPGPQEGARPRPWWRRVFGGWSP